MKVLATILLVCIIGCVSGYITRAVTEDEAAVREYWTEERMREAIDRDVILAETGPEPFADPANLATPVEAAEPVFSEGFAGEAGDHEKRYPFPYSSGYAPTYTAYPWRAVGKVFFTTGGLNYVCSAAVINAFTIHTAGHCVFDSTTRSFVTNFVFYPGFNNNFAPYGPWYARNYFIHSDWQNVASFCRDYATVVLYRNTAGQGVGNVVGWFGYAYNYGYNQNWRALGYPQAAPFNGQYNYFADSNFGIQDTRCGGKCNVGGACTPFSIGIGSDATGGTSGGPWILGFGSNNWLNGVNSYKYNNQPAAIYGPYLDTVWYQTIIAPAIAIVP